MREGGRRGHIASLFISSNSRSSSSSREGEGRVHTGRKGELTKGGREEGEEASTHLV